MTLEIEAPKTDTERVVYARAEVMSQILKLQGYLEDKEMTDDRMELILHRIMDLNRIKFMLADDKDPLKP